MLPVWRLRVTKEIYGHFRRTARNGILLGGLSFIVALVVLAVTGDGLGGDSSPKRLLLINLFAFLFCLPFGVYWMARFAQRRTWQWSAQTRPRGKRNRVVTAFSPGVIALIIIVGAVFALAGLGDLGGLDFQAMVIAASAASFGSIVSFFGLFFGQFIARVFINPLWMGGASARLYTIFAYTLIDASIWSYCGYLYFYFVHQRRGAFLPGFLIAWGLTLPIHQAFWFITYWIINTPENALRLVTEDWVRLSDPVGNLIPLPYWWLSGLLFVPLGYLIGQLVHRLLYHPAETKASSEK